MTDTSIAITFIACNAKSTRAGGQIEQQVSARTGISLMQAAQDANIPGIEADCGGMLSCGTCHVMLREPWASLIPPPGIEELGMLEFTATTRQPTSRLSCQVILTPALDGMTVELPIAQH